MRHKEGVPLATTYCVIIDGVADAARSDRVVAELAFTFKRSREKTARMLARVPYAVRKGIDFRTAVKYETLLRNCGCLCKIEPEPYEVSTRPVAAAAVSPGADSAPVQVRGARALLDRGAWTARLAAARGALRSPRVSWVAAAAIAPLVLAGIYVAWPATPGAAPLAAPKRAAAPSPGRSPSPTMTVGAPAGPSASGSAQLRPMQRNDFEAAVVGKFEAEVIAAIGPPASSSENWIGGSRMALWTYYDRTRESDAGTIDKAVFIQLRDGRAESFLY